MVKYLKKTETDTSPLTTEAIYRVNTARMSAGSTASEDQEHSTNNTSKLKQPTIEQIKTDEVPNQTIGLSAGQTALSPLDKGREEGQVDKKRNETVAEGNEEPPKIIGIDTKTQTDFDEHLSVKDTKTQTDFDEHLSVKNTETQTDFDEQHLAGIDETGNSVLRKKGFQKRILCFIKDVVKTDLQLFMAYTAATVTFSFLVGSLMSGLLNQWYNVGQEERLMAMVMEELKNGPTKPASTMDNQTDWRQKLDVCEAKWNQTLNDVKNLETKLISTKEEISMNQTRLEDTILYKQFAIEGNMSTLTSYFLNSAWSYLIVLLGLGEVLLLVVFIKILPVTGHLMNPVQLDRQNDIVEWNDNGDSRIQGSDEILGQVRRTNLESGVCTVSFHSECANKHNDQINAILKSSHVSTCGFLLNRHEDILRVPDKKVYVVYVDFNERNVILEDPTKGLGDLRLTTVQALQKKGGDVMLVYARDIGSKHLPPDALYNVDLTSIKSHPELSRLSANNRMFSIFDKFSISQKEQIRRVVAERMQYKN